MNIDDLPTPALLLDLDRVDRNIAWMAERASALGVTIRPHIKTHKCIEIAERQRDAGALGITAATLREAEDFAAHGFDDITWAFPIPLTLVPAAASLAERVTLRTVIDSREALDALEATGTDWHVWLKIDSGYHRAGVDPASDDVLDLVRRMLDSRKLAFDGLLTHAGHTYAGPTPAESLAAAREERDVMVSLAAELESLGLPVPALSVGSTPGMRAIDHLEGLSECRPGNYVFFDDTMVALGAATPADCAVSVLASVISSQLNPRRSIVDAGALALSKDPGRGGVEIPTMGRIYSDYACGALRDDLWLTGLSQEHGMIHGRLAVGEKVRVLPNHSCLTVACFDEYHVVKGDEVVDRWKIWRGR
jgi:D-serine deaminase-like pyridoxal phosphate-dependent protein